MSLFSYSRLQFLVRDGIQHVLSTPYAIARPSVCHTGDHTKTVEVKIMKFSPYGSPIPLVLA